MRRIVSVIPNRLLIVAVIALRALMMAPDAEAQTLRGTVPEELEGVGVTEQRGETVPLQLTFTDSSGRTRALGEFFDGERPVVLILGYYDCPLLCTLVFNRALEAFNGAPFTMGDDYRALAVSIDHTNTPELAHAKQELMLESVQKLDEGAKDPWTFLVGDAASARALADSVGYHYRFLPETGEFAHAAALVILAPDGTISNYLIGLDYQPWKLRMALLDAADGKIGTIFDGFLHYCFVYDPDRDSYTLVAFRAMQVAGGATVLVIGAGLGLLFLTGKRGPWRARHGFLTPVEPAPATETEAK